MGKTPAQENRAKAKKEGLSHEAAKKQAQKETHEIKKLANEAKQKGFGASKQMQAAIEKKQKEKDKLDPTTEEGKKHLKAQRKAMQEELDFLMRSGKGIVQPPLEPGQDPATVLCVFFQKGLCAKFKCKFSHDINLGKKGAKKSIYDSDEAKAGDKMDEWDTNKLRDVVEEKHGGETNHNLSTTIVCKHFIDAVEKNVYGWFWNCPGGKDCKYRHSLPTGYVLPSERKALAREALASVKTDNDHLEEKLLAMLNREGEPAKDPLNDEKFQAWKAKKKAKLAADQERDLANRKKTNLLTGREQCELGMMKHDQDDDSAEDLTAAIRQLRVTEAEDEKQAAVEAARAIEEMAADAADMEADAKAEAAEAVEAEAAVQREVEDVPSTSGTSAADVGEAESALEKLSVDTPAEEPVTEEVAEVKAEPEKKKKGPPKVKKHAPKKVNSKKDAKGKGKEKPDDAIVIPAGGPESKDSGVFRCVTGVLSSQPTSRDIKIDGFSMGLGGSELIKDCSIELTIGRRYGLLGQNGCGKTNFLECLALREVPIPSHMDLYHLKEEAEPSDKSAVDSVIDYIKDEMAALEALEEKILEEFGPEDERLQLVYERLDSLDPSTFEVRAIELLHGLGFSKKMMARCTKDMSGGWRMRVALARALFVQPTLLLLDEPTNHLDLEACVWLEQYLKGYNKCLIIISHSQDFLNGVCTHIIWLTQQKLNYYTGNYDTYVKTVAENEVVQMKKYQKEQDDIKHLKAFIAGCGTYSNLVKQAKSKQKILDKMEADGLTKPVVRERTFKFQFPECEKLPPPVMPFVDVSFSYSGNEADLLYKNVSFGLDCDSRVALVGPNGAGKSTLLKLMLGELSPNSGTVSRHTHLVIGRYHQHSTDVLDETMTVLEFFMHTYPNTMSFKRDVDEWRAFVGRYGISGKMQASKIGALSEGQKSRIVFAMICMARPNMLLLDEPTNHLDIEAIDALAEAILKYNGGLVLVSHDFRLIDQVANDIWVCEKQSVTPWKGDIRQYKKALAAGMGVTI